MAPIMNITNLFSGYGNKTILKDVNLAVNDGDILGIIGPNGSGKTTLLKTVCGIIKPDSGEVLIENRHLYSLSTKEIAQKVAVVTQSIEPVMISVSDYVVMGRMPYYKKFQFFETKDDYMQAEKFMRLTDTIRIKDQYMSEISGGERQLAQVARALVQQPVILLLDEPTSHLDITHQIKILDLIRRLNKELNLTVVMVIHDLNLASEYCTKLTMLKNGKIYNTGTPKQVLTYEAIEKVYNTIVIVEKNPLSGKPFIIPVTEENKQTAKI
ncbi:MAG TPA: ABC transporter ATP-binding protein [Victivallales bacterium]|nr:ABC transporter ATP-binding protein [Victivallales bacterium]